MRLPRKQSNTDIYHVIAKGASGNVLFVDHEDYLHFLKCLEYYKSKCDIEIYAYCLMSNHIHILLKTSSMKIGKVMQHLLNKWDAWWKKKYDHIGPLFNGRYKSEPVETQGYFQTVLAYINNNPVKAGICTKAQDYPYSSMQSYIHGYSNIINIKATLNNFNVKSLKTIIGFINAIRSKYCMDVDELRLSDNAVLRLLHRLLNSVKAEKFSNIGKKCQKRIIKNLKRLKVSIGQFRRISGIPFDSLLPIWRCS